MSLMVMGIAATLVAPIAGAISAVSAYLLNPHALSLPDRDFGYQFWTTAAFLISLALHRSNAVPRMGREGLLLVSLWAFGTICSLSATWAVVSPQETLKASWEMIKTLILVTCLIRAVNDERHVYWFVTACCLGVFHAAALHTFGFKLGMITTAMDREEGVLIESQPTRNF